VILHTEYSSGEIKDMSPKKVIALLIAALSLSLASCQPGREPARPPVLLGQDVKEAITTTLASMKGPVTLHLYHGGAGETAERETRAVLDFMADSSPQISVVDHALDQKEGSPEKEFSPGVNHGPVIRIEGANRGSLVFYGYPERRELKPFLEGVLLASGYPDNLPAVAEAFLADLDQDIRIRIFTTPD